MAPRFRQKISSLVSLFALLVNLLPPPPLAQAREEALTPADHAHRGPVPTLIGSHKSLTPVTTRADAVLPHWFKPPITSPIDSNQTAGLTLAKPAAIVHLPRAEASSQKPVVSSQKSVPRGGYALVRSQPSAVVLPDWFRVPAAETSAPTAVGGQPPALRPKGVSNGSAVVLPGWFSTPPAEASIPIHIHRLKACLRLTLTVRRASPESNMLFRL